MARVRHGAGPRGCGAPATHRPGARPCPREQNIRTATAERAPVGDGNSHRARKDKESAREDEPVAHRVRRGRRPRAADGLRGGPAPKPKFEAEKCYGISKAGKNDCQTANSSCAGTSKRDNQGDAWIYIPAGSCDKVVGGSKEPKKA